MSFTNAELVSEADSVLDRWLRLASTWSDRNRAIEDAASFVDMAALVAHRMPDTLTDYPAWHLSQKARERASAVFAEAIGVAYAPQTPSDLLTALRAAELDYRRVERDVQQRLSQPSKKEEEQQTHTALVERQRSEQQILGLREKLERYRVAHPPLPSSDEALQELSKQARACLLDVRMTTRGTLLMATGSHGRVERLIPALTRSAFSVDIARPLAEIETLYRQDQGQDPELQSKWIAVMERAYATLSEHLGDAIHETLGACGDPGGNGLVFVSPSGLLTRFPFAGLLTRAGYLVDHWAFALVPHFGFVARRTRQDTPSSLAFCAHDVPLMSACTHVLFPGDSHLDNSPPQRALEALYGKSLVWFSCHGAFDDEEPLQSRLMIGGQEQAALTLEAMLRGSSLHPDCHIVLAACQVGRTDPSDEQDQMLGFGHAFLLKGACSVWACAWDAFEAVGAFVWEHAEARRKQGIHPAIALAQAQRDYLRCSSEELSAAIKRWPPVGKMWAHRLSLRQGQSSVARWASFVTFGGGVA